MNFINETEEKLSYRKIHDYVIYLNDEMGNSRDLSIVIVESEKMQELNREFREKDYPTDVLTFCEQDHYYLGDVIINIDKVREQAKEYNHSFRRELFFLITHGYLHLLGYDHQVESDAQVMFSLQEKLLRGYNIPREEQDEK